MFSDQTLNFLFHVCFLPLMQCILRHHVCGLNLWLTDNIYFRRPVVSGSGSRPCPLFFSIIRPSLSRNSFFLSCISRKKKRSRPQRNSPCTLISCTCAFLPLQTSFYVLRSAFHNALFYESPAEYLPLRSFF